MSEKYVPGKLEIPLIEVYGAREHNLKDIDISLPRNALVVITGVSGSGKSSLAFDTLFAEGQRRYMETFSAYARQFAGSFERPDVDKITGLSPVISIEQKTTNKNPRSTVGTVTEIYDFLRLLYARAGEAISSTGQKMVSYSAQQITDIIQQEYEGRRIILLAPVVKGRKGHYRELFTQIQKKGYIKVRIDGHIIDITPQMQVDRFKIHDIEIVVDRLAIAGPDTRIEQSVEKALQLGDDLVLIMDHDSGEVKAYSKKLVDPETGVAFEEPSPNTFSFNSPYGACEHCKGLGYIQEINESLLVPDTSKSIKEGAFPFLTALAEFTVYKKLEGIGKKFDFSLSTPYNDISKQAKNYILHGSREEKISIQHNKLNYSLSFEGLIPLILRCYEEAPTEKLKKAASEYLYPTTCTECGGYRLKKSSLLFLIDGQHIGQLSNLDLHQLAIFFADIAPRLTAKQNAIAKDIVKEISARLQFLLDVGLEYLSLDRPSYTLSGGESQRIRLATQIGSKLSGITYILDEPSIGLHQRDNHRLIQSLRELVDQGNSVLVVEHDKDIMLAADHLVDLGPGAGEKGGRIMAEGLPSQFHKKNGITADYLSGRKEIKIPAERRTGSGKILSLFQCTGHNLKNTDLHIPLGKLICVTGVSGSGKSSLINETLYPILKNHFYNTHDSPLPYKTLAGLAYLDKVIDVDQAPIGRTPRSNPATYIGFFNDIRNLFSMTPEAKIRGYAPGRFSFNVKGGRCETCQGGGMRVIEMNFLPDVMVPCEDCQGRRYNRETLEIRYKGKSICDVLNMNVDEGVIFFEPIPKIYRQLKVLQDVGLGYITIGQSAPTLSGGEAQRVKLATELGKKDTGHTLYILDEPTTGLHFEDIRHLIEVLEKLVDKGNTVIVIEHNMDIIKMADHIIDVGPEAGNKGGIIIFEGTPELLIKVRGSHTADYLRTELK